MHGYYSISVSNNLKTGNCLNALLIDNYHFLKRLSTSICTKYQSMSLDTLATP